MLSIRLIIVMTCAALVTACASDPTARTCSTGIVCPSPLQCAAVQAVCITNNCGNGHIDPGEICDDGNINDGDGCSHDCLSMEVCGNGVVDPGEVCDDGNTVSGDGCSADCKSREVCGNGIVDVGEVCDDGGTFDGKCGDNTPCNSNADCTTGKCAPDGCSKNCKSDETCGNDIVDLGEACDGTSGCEPNCQAGIGCGNGTIDTGEACDDGNTDNNDDCTNDCQINVCGDNILDTDGEHHEDCDPGTGGVPLETAACNIDCTFASCGDNKINKARGEQCDNGTGNNADDNDCTSTCQINVCGDGLVDTIGVVAHREACDDGNTVENDGCTNECTLPHCGNGIVDMGEDCDLGAANSDTGTCTSTCHFPTCGDHLVEAGVEQCDGAAADGHPCNNATCREMFCGNGIIDMGEQCDDGNTADNDGCSHDCKFELCGDGIVNNHEVCDWALTPATCNLDCTTSTCGDGKVNPHAVPPEQCDGTPGCSALCQLQHCGNGVVDPGEQCDGAAGLQPCNTTTCQQKKCGNSVVDPGMDNLNVVEQCDNGLLNADTAACTSTCQIAKCGDGLKEAGIEECDNGLTTGNGDNKDCTADCKTNVCGDGKIDNTGTHHEDCDEGVNNGLLGHCDVFCHNPMCGNGLVDNGEQCDTMGIDTSTCVAATCTTSRCGDGYKNPAVPAEQCDAGVLNTNDNVCPYNTSCAQACSTTCKLLTMVTPDCGDGVVNGPNETCDDSGATLAEVAAGFCPYGEATCVACDASCHIKDLTGPTCGDGHTDAGETCDDSHATEGVTECPYGSPAGTCDVCHHCVMTHLTNGSYCGDGKLDEFDGEQCDMNDIGDNTCPIPAMPQPKCSTSCVFSCQAS